MVCRHSDQEIIDSAKTSGLTDYPGGVNYFKITSAATTGNAKRKVESIYYTSKLDVPTAYYTPNNITIQGNINVSGVSFFAKGNINIIGNSVTINRNTADLYGDWDTTQFNPPLDLNTIPRTDASGNRKAGAGLATEGLVCKGKTCSGSADSVADGVYDYDSTTGAKGSGKEFMRKSDPYVPNDPGEISYPFNPNAKFDLDFLAEEAKRQGNYYSSPVDITNSNYPTDSDSQTVFFVDAGGSTGELKYRVDRTPKAQGTIIVRNGNLTINNSSNGFKGVIIVDGDGVNTGTYDNGGSDSIEGFAIASGDMEIRGSTSPFVVDENFTTRPGFYGVRQWSWRECYTETCD